MIKDNINSYYNNFVLWMSKSLKEGWGMQMKIYVFSYGAVIVVNMERGIAHRLIIKGESNNLGEALRKTGLFEEDKIKPLSDKGVTDTIIGILSTTRYVLFKNADNSCWGELSAKKDVDTIITKVKSQHDKR